LLNKRLKLSWIDHYRTCLGFFTFRWRW